MVRILLFSDLHACTPDREGNGISSFLVNSRKEQYNPSPLEAAANLMVEEGIEIDWVLCAGDMATKAEPEGQLYAWEELQKVKKILGAKVLIGAVGNHDIDSRFDYDDHDPKGAVQDLADFPMGNETLNNHFWSKNYAIYEEGNFRLININSAAFHGYAPEPAKSTPPEYKHGRIDKRIIKNILRDIKDNQLSINIILTHHHVIYNKDITYDDYSVMKNGQHFLSEICKTIDGGVIVLHGHEHWPQLIYGPIEGGYAPVIFSAASTCTHLVSPMSASVSNQFYCIEIEDEEISDDGWLPCGQVQAWHWVPEDGWQCSPPDMKIPSEIGFGVRDTAKKTANDVVDYLKKQPISWASLAEIRDKNPKFKYLTASDLRKFINEFKKKGHIVTPGVTFSEYQFRLKEGL